MTGSPTGGRVAPLALTLGLAFLLLFLLPERVPPVIRHVRGQESGTRAHH